MHADGYHDDASPRRHSFLRLRAAERQVCHPPLTANKTMVLTARPAEWREQIQSIITETERNLGMRARPRPLAPATTMNIGGGAASRPRPV